MSGPLYTLDEARERRCCVPGVGETTATIPGGRCRAAGCMAWRWWDVLTDDGTACHHKPIPHAARVPEPPAGRPLAQRRGFCGLAGRTAP